MAAEHGNSAAVGQCSHNLAAALYLGPFRQSSGNLYLADPISFSETTSSADSKATNNVKGETTWLWKPDFVLFHSVLVAVHDYEVWNTVQCLSMCLVLAGTRLQQYENRQ